MMMDTMEYILQQLECLIRIDSPSGFTQRVSEYLLEEYRRLGYEPSQTVKGGVLTELGGEGQGILLMSHVDTLGAVVSEITAEGHLRLSPVGGLEANNVEGENCRIYTFDDRVYEGTIWLENASVHVNEEYHTAARNFQSLEVVLDENVSAKEDVQSLGICNGCFVCPEPRFRVTEKGFIKSRFLDDKLCTAVMLGFARYLKEAGITPARKIYQHITVFEEVGHGGCASVPADVEDVLSLDMGCVGKGLECTEHQVSICVKDSRGPYNQQLTRQMIQAAQKKHLNFACDVYPHYGSDVDAALFAGVDVRHGLIGPGIYSSHGYERTHREAVENTFHLLTACLLER